MFLPETLTLDPVAPAYRQARQERLVIDLAAGATTIKKYRFPDVTPAPDAKARSGIKETDGVRILNNEVAVE